jgi:hypothetical protein
MTRKCLVVITVVCSSDVVTSKNSVWGWWQYSLSERIQARPKGPKWLCVLHLCAFRPFVCVYGKDIYIYIFLLCPKATLTRRIYFVSKKCYNCFLLSALLFSKSCFFNCVPFSCTSQSFHGGGA